MDLLHTLLEICTTLTRRVEHLEQDKIAQTLEITKLKQKVKKLERKNKLKASGLRRLRKIGTAQRVESSGDTVMDDVSKQREIIADMDADEDVTMKDVAVVAKEVAVEKIVEIKENADVQGRQAESQAQIYQIDLKHADKVLSMQDDELEPAELKEVVKVVTTAKLMTEVVIAASATITAATTLITAATLTAAPSAARRRKGVISSMGELTCTTLTRKVEALEQDKVAQALDIIKLKQMVKKLERKNKLKVSGLRRLKKVGTAQRVESSRDTVIDDVSKQGEIIANMDANKDVTLKDVVVVAKEVVVEKDDEIKENDDELEPAELKEVVKVVTTAKLMTEVVIAASATITAATTLITAATLTAAPSAARRRKGVVIRDPEESATPSIIIHFEPKSKDKGKGIMVEEPKPLKKQAQIEQDEAYAREKPQTESQARKNMMIYLRNMAGFKMDYFKGMSYDDIRPIFEKYFNSNVAFQEKTKEQMEEEDIKALKRASESQAKKEAKK
nr:hypothetical protein [Tanacetum cinerariifolium]